MKAIMISIKPRGVVLIANGKKTIEVRKTKPKIEMPFKCYIYCCESKNKYFLQRYNGRIAEVGSKIQTKHEYAVELGNKKLNGKVIGEFVCDKIDTYDDDTIHTHSQEDFTMWNDYELDKACIHEEDLENYANDKWLYGWHISDLVIYDNPRELGEFKTPPCEKSENACGNCKYLKVTNTPMAYEVDCWGEDGVHLTRPPKSWQYVEELK